MGAHDVTRCSFFLGGTRVEVVKLGVQMNETRWRQLGRRDEKKQKKKKELRWTCGGKPRWIRQSIPTTFTLVEQL